MLLRTGVIASLGLASLIIVNPGNASIINGGFETGDFAGWTQVSNLGGSGCATDWYVSPTDTQCQFASTILNPAIEGSFAAYNSFDGPGPVSFSIEQDIALGSDTLSTADLGWSHTVGWNFGLGIPATLDRVFSMSFLDSSDNLIGEAFNLSIGPADGVSGFIDWTANSVDVLGLLSGFEGQTVTLLVDTLIPQNFSGPGSLGLDDIQLALTTTSVSEPETLALLGLGLAVLGLRSRMREKRSRD